MTLRWLVNRLRLMSFGEIFYRAKQSARHSFEKLCLNTGWEPRPGSPVSTRLEIVNRNLIEEFSRSNFLSPAENLSRGRLALFKYEDLYVGWPINWHRDPLTGITSPANQVGKAIDYRKDELVGDIKVLWEMGRQQFLVPVALQYYLDREQAQLDVIAGVIQSWITENPYGYGIHWCSSLEVAYRGISWSIVHQFLLASGLPKGIFSLEIDSSALEKQIYQHAVFIRGFLSRYSSANNHLVGELTGLHLLCSLFDMGAKAETWRNFAWKSLLKESALQVYEDGVNKEQAIYYHCEVLEHFLINYLIAGHNRQAVPDTYVLMLSKMAQFVSDLTPMGGGPPQLGDADDGIAIQFSQKSSPFYKDLIETVNALAGALPDEALGIKAQCYRMLQRAGTGGTPMPVVDSAYPMFYPKGGYAVLGKPKFHAVFDCGSLGYTSLAAHGHADMLSICLAIDGEWWLVDPGTYSYHSDQVWRDYFRGSLGHNVLTINGLDQSEIGGPFMWVRHAAAHFDGVESSAGVHQASGWHNGYLDEAVPRIGRKVKVDAATEQLLITDYIECEGEAEASINFHFSPDVKCVEQSGNSLVLNRSGTANALQLEFPDSISVKSYYGDKELPAGWYSSSLGVKEPCLSIRATVQVKSNTNFTTRLAVIRDNR